MEPLSAHARRNSTHMAWHPPTERTQHRHSVVAAGWKGRQGPFERPPGDTGPLGGRGDALTRTYEEEEEDDDDEEEEQQEREQEEPEEERRLRAK